MSSYQKTDLPKDPGDVMDYAFDWGDKKANTNIAGDNGYLQGDTINSSSWTPDSGITVDSDSHDGRKATVWLSGGTVGVTYKVVNKIVTAGGRTKERTLLVPVDEN